MNTPVEIDRDDLYDRFIRQQWTVVKLAEYYRCSIRTILRVLDRYEIPRPQPEQLPPIPADELRARYVERRETLRQVAEHYGCSITRVCSFLDRYQIPRRGQGWNSYSDWNDLSTRDTWAGRADIGDHDVHLGEGAEHLPARRDVEIAEDGRRTSEVGSGYRAVVPGVLEGTGGVADLT